MYNKEEKTVIGYIFRWLLIIVPIVLILGFIGNASGLFNLAFWEVKKENARREVFENTQSYVEAKRQELLKLYVEYQKASNNDEKQAIKFIVQQSFANVDNDKFDGKLRVFLEEMKYE